MKKLITAVTATAVLFLAPTMIPAAHAGPTEFVELVRTQPSIKGSDALPAPPGQRDLRTQERGPHRPRPRVRARRQRPG